MMAMIVFHRLIKRDSNTFWFRRVREKKSNYIFKWQIDHEIYTLLFGLNGWKLKIRFICLFVCVCFFLLLLLSLFGNERIKCCNDWYRYWAHNEQMPFLSIFIHSNDRAASITMAISTSRSLDLFFGSFYLF